MDSYHNSITIVQIFVWNTDGWEKQKNRFLQFPAGRTPPAQADTRVQFHQDQFRFLVVHETQLAIYEATKLECLKQVGSFNFSFMLAANNLSIFCLMYDAWITVVPARCCCTNITCNFLM